jgi:carboxymethylenebutenolidase
MEGLRVGAVGFCWGGSLAFLCATRLSLPAVGYYGARSVPYLDEKAGAALMFHFGAEDPSIPPDVVEQHRQKQPQARVHVYEGAGHAFNRDVDPNAYHEAAAKPAWERTLQFFEEQLR